MTSRSLASPLPTAAGVADRVVETLLSTVLFAGERVWKLRKPLELPYLDQRSAQMQRRLCEREMALNARLAPDVYLGVVEVEDPRGGGRRPATVMRRLPESRSLTALIGAGEDLHHQIREIAHSLAAFHLSAPCGPEVAAAGSPEALEQRWTGALAVLRSFGDIVPAKTVAEVGSLAGAYLAGRGPLLAQRVATDKIVDGHGDLLADDVFCLDDGPRFIDCLEFSDELRHCDTISDVASLVMDLERLGAPELGDLLLREYAGHTADSFPSSLAHHYIAYRAVVRCEVACLRHAQGDRTAAITALQLIGIALRHSRQSLPMLVLVGGPPGAGKSTVAATTADALRWTVLRSDEVRREVVGGETWAGSSEWLSARFSRAATETTYGVLCARAQALLGLGESVILDATWASAAQRDAAAGAAARTCSGLVMLLCRVPARVAERRVGRRIAAGRDISMATVAVARQIRAEFDPWPSAIPIDTGAARMETMAAALGAISAATEQDREPQAREEAVL